MWFWWQRSIVRKLLLWLIDFHTTHSRYWHWWVRRLSVVLCAVCRVVSTQIEFIYWVRGVWESRTHPQRSFAKQNAKNIIKLSHVPHSVASLYLYGARESVCLSLFLFWLAMVATVAASVFCVCSQNSFIFVVFRSCWLCIYLSAYRKNFLAQKGKNCLFNCFSASPVCIQ